MKNLLIALSTLVLISCAVQEPKEQEVKDVVNRWYQQKSSGGDSGSWDVSGITVVSVKRDTDNKKQFTTSCFATGTFHSPTATVKPDEPFADSVSMKIEWNGAKWITVQE